MCRVLRLVAPCGPRFLRYCTRYEVEPPWLHGWGVPTIVPRNSRCGHTACPIDRAWQMPSIPRSCYSSISWLYPSRLLTSKMRCEVSVRYGSSARLADRSKIARIYARPCRATLTHAHRHGRSDLTALDKEKPSQKPKDTGGAGRCVAGAFPNFFFKDTWRRDC